VAARQFYFAAFRSGANRKAYLQGLLSKSYRIIAIMFSLALLVRQLVTAEATAMTATKERPSAAFFYGRSIPLLKLAHFDWVVVEAESLRDPQELQGHGVEVFAYVSVGEAEPWRASSSALHPDWLVGKNQAWKTPIVDLTQRGWQDYVLEQRMAPLWRQGYRGFFLDTLDSYKLAVTGAEAIQAQETSLIALIEAVQTRFPGVKLLANRGFDIMPKVAKWLTGVVAESLYASWDPIAKVFKDVSPADRSWLLDRLHDVQNRYHCPVIVIDYVDPKQPARAGEVARRIAADGFVPWVTTPLLDTIGVGLSDLNTIAVASGSNASTVR
jgi:polysaccharide biosynthesis protein PelA